MSGHFPDTCSIRRFSFPILARTSSCDKFSILIPHTATSVGSSELPPPLTPIPHWNPFSINPLCFDQLFQLNIQMKTDANFFFCCSSMTITWNCMCAVCNFFSVRSKAILILKLECSAIIFDKHLLLFCLLTLK